MAKATPSAIALGFVCSSLLNALGIFFFVKVLHASEVMSWELSWSRCALLSIIYMVLRLWDSLIFGQKKG
jgi:hypothetical protein|tara:strand:+ start:4310 stop:4519 length:210 start_codon:yes stop_codon:yes gene_type:complete